MSYDYYLLNKNINLEILKKLQCDYIKYDNDYFLNYDRKRYKVNKRRNRTVTTEYGKVTYSRRIYVEKATGKSFSPTDLFVNIQPYQRIINHVKNIIINQIATGKRNRDIKDMIPNCSLSLITISRLLKNTIFKMQDSTKKVILEEDSYLYINMDDTYQYTKVNNKRVKHRVRVISFNTGITKGKLNNKRFAYIMTKPKKTIKQEDFIKFIWDNINKYYKFECIKLVVGGDGASWIKQTAKALGARYIVDKYHCIKYLWNVFVAGKNKKVKTNWDNYVKAYELFVNGNYKELMALLKNKTIKKIYNYFKLNKEGVINQAASWNIGVSAESDIFHLVKSIKGNGAKIYDVNTFNNMLLINISRHNNIAYTH